LAKEDAMQLLKVICVVIPCMLLLVASTPAEVYDDEGKVITKEEIVKEEGSIGRIGCGSCVILLTIEEIATAYENKYDMSDEIIGLVPAVLLLSGIGYMFGKYIDRQIAIENIKVRRRMQERQDLKNRMTLPAQPDSKSVKNQKMLAHMGFKVKEIAERLIIQCFIDVFS
jgi:hypothetical protein